MIVRNQRKSLSDNKDIVDLYNVSGDYLITVYNFFMMKQKRWMMIIWKIMM